jgi:hypothetical protein
VKLVAAFAIAACLPHVAHSQRLAGPQPEMRLEFITGDPWSIMAGAGVGVPAGIYTRLGINAAAGMARADSVTHAAARIDATARFLLDPLRQSKTGLYGLAGLSAMYLDGDGWTPRVVLGLGLEGRVRGRAITSVELALGGGARISVVMRRARPAGR